MLHSLCLGAARSEGQPLGCETDVGKTGGEGRGTFSIQLLPDILTTGRPVWLMEQDCVGDYTPFTGKHEKHSVLKLTIHSKIFIKVILYLLHRINYQFRSISSEYPGMGWPHPRPGQYPAFRHEHPRATRSTRAPFRFHGGTLTGRTSPHARRPPQPGVQPLPRATLRAGAGGSSASTSATVVVPRALPRPGRGSTGTTAIGCLAFPTGCRVSFRPDPWRQVMVRRRR